MAQVKRNEFRAPKTVPGVVRLGDFFQFTHTAEVTALRDKKLLSELNFLLRKKFSECVWRRSRKFFETKFYAKKGRFSVNSFGIN